MPCGPGVPSRRPPHPRSFQPWAPPAREHRAAGPLGNPWAQLGPTERWPFPRVSHSGGRFRSYNGNSRPGSRASQKGRMHETRVCQGGRGGGGGWHTGTEGPPPAAPRPPGARTVPPDSRGQWGPVPPGKPPGWVWRVAVGPERCSRTQSPPRRPVPSPCLAPQQPCRHCQRYPVP